MFSEGVTGSTPVASTIFLRIFNDFETDPSFIF